MKQFNNFRRKLLPVAALAAVIAAVFAGCTKVDDTLGGNLIPDNQQMKAGYVELLGEKVNPRKYVETRLFQSDSLIGSNISYGYFGTCINDTLGERKAGFLSQMLITIRSIRVISDTCRSSTRRRSCSKSPA